MVDELWHCGPTSHLLLLLSLLLPLACLLQDYPDFRQAESLKQEVDELWLCGCTSYLLLLLLLLLLCFDSCRTTQTSGRLSH
jgi:hypothetical protein